MARWFLLVCLAFFVASPAQAWTRAQVKEARVDLVLGAGPSLGVSLDLGVEVSGGWLERLEVLGLEGLPTSAGEVSAWLTREDGSEATPEVRLKPGSAELKLVRSEAPKRGMHRLGLRYQAETFTANQQGAFTRIEWTLPGWEAGLDHAEVRFRLPQGARAVSDSELAQEVSEEVGPEGEVWVRFVRVHVPRETPWRVAVDVPLAAGGNEASRGHGRAGYRLGEQSEFAAATFCVLALCFAGLRRVRRAAAGLNGRTRSLLGTHGKLQLWGALALVALSVALVPWSIWAGLGLMFLATLVLSEHVIPGERGPDLGQFEPMGSLQLAACRRTYRRELVGLVPFIDVGSLLGATLVLGLLLAAGWAIDPEAALPVWSLALACSVVPLCTAARFALPRTLATRVRALEQAAGELRLSGVALNLLWYRPHTGGHEEPRLRVWSARPHQGLLRIDVLADTRSGAPALTLCAVVLADTTAHRALKSDWSRAHEVQNQAGKRCAFFMPVADFAVDLQTLLTALSNHEQRAVDEWTSEESCAA